MADITAKPVTVTGITASDKVYDGLNSVVVDSSGASGWVLGDDITISSTGVFSDKNVGTEKTVTLPIVHRDQIQVIIILLIKRVRPLTLLQNL